MVSLNEIVSDDLCPSKTCTLKALWENWGRHVELRNEVTISKQKGMLYVAYIPIQLHILNLLNFDLQVQS